MTGSCWTGASARACSGACCCSTPMKLRATHFLEEVAPVQVLRRQVQRQADRFAAALYAAKAQG
eukprot:gene36878-45493_t